jgi:hypothetical protein
MGPRIDGTAFGSITIAGEAHEHDVLICLDGSIRRRKKKLSKKHYGTSHTVSREEAEQVYEDGAEMLVFGTGQSGRAELSAEAASFFQEQGCAVRAMPTPEAIKAWNAAEGAAIGLFHLTC